MKKEMVVFIAIVCHQANKAWCEANGDTSQKDWNEAEEWQRESAIKGVEFRLANPESGKDAQHNAWMKDKVDAGWVYGEEKNPEAKTHPCIVPFEQLPEFQQKKDALFCAVVDALKDKTEAELQNVIEVLEKGNGDDLVKQEPVKEEATSPNLSGVLPRKLTLGEYRVGITFNTGGHPKVNEIKALAAGFINQIEGRSKEDALKTGNDFKAYCEKEEKETTNPEAARCFNLAGSHVRIALDGLSQNGFTGAQNDMETAAMWAVKGATKPDVPEGGF